jgi:hypothetical protein
MKKIIYLFLVLLTCSVVVLFFYDDIINVQNNDESVEISDINIDSEKDTIEENSSQNEDVLEDVSEVEEFIIEGVAIEKGVIYNIDSIRYFLHEDRTATVTHNGFYNKNVYYCWPNEMGECTNDSNGYVAKTIVIPSVVEYCGVEFSVTEIDEMAFAFCPFTDTVVIPSSVEKIGNAAFYITNIIIICQNPEPPIVDGEYLLGEFDFMYEYDDVSLIVPKGSIQAYKEHKAWGKFKKIEAIVED